MAEEPGITLEHTPTWIVAIVTTVIIALSLAVERLLHYAGKYLTKKDQKPLFQALQKIKEELMLLGFISLLLTVFQQRISQLCISKELATSSAWTPCKADNKTAEVGPEPETTAHFHAFFSSLPYTATRHLLAEAVESKNKSETETETDPSAKYCMDKGKLPLLSGLALHHLHIFIFTLACVHVIFCALTILFGSAKIRQWKAWEKFAQDGGFDPTKVLKSKDGTDVQDHSPKQNWFQRIEKRVAILSWIHSFFKQFYRSVSKSDYITLRQGFINTHCRGNPKFDFHRYMMRALEADFKKVVGISWYLWIFVVVFLMLNVNEWQAYFWIAFIPFIMLLAVGTKLENIIIQLAQDVAEKHASVEGAIAIEPNDDLFWFHSPHIVLFLIHMILFQNSFEFAFFFWIWIQYGFDSCIMGKLPYIIPRLFIGAFIQFVCSYSTLPLYAIVTQMGSSFNKAIFDQHTQKGLIGWATRNKGKGGLMKKAAASNGGSSTAGRKEDSSTSGKKEESVSRPALQLSKIIKQGDNNPDSSTGGNKEESVSRPPFQFPKIIKQGDIKPDSSASGDAK